MSEHKSRRELVAVRFLSWLPFGLVRGLVGGLAWLASWLPLSWVSAHRDVLVNQLACFPELDWRTARRRARAAFVQTVRTLASFSHVWLRPVDDTMARIRRVEGDDQVRASLAAGRPVMILSLHQAAWEVPVLVVGQITPAVVMYQPSPSELDDVVKAARERTGCRLVAANARGVRAALGELEAGGAFVLLADHQPGGKTNPAARFFGHLVPVPGFVAKVVQRYQPDVYFLSAQYEGDDAHYSICFERAPDDLQAGDSPDILEATMAGLERIIRRAPLNYHWTYNRFRRGDGFKRRWYKKDQAMAMLRRVRVGEPAGDVFRDIPEHAPRKGENNG